MLSSECDQAARLLHSILSIILIADRLSTFFATQVLAENQNAKYKHGRENGNRNTKGVSARL
jgi:hypothetical protein